MERYSFLAIAISFLAMVAGTAVADNSVSKPVQASTTIEDNRCRQDLRNTGQSSGGICNANPYPF